MPQKIDTFSESEKKKQKESRERVEFFSEKQKLRRELEKKDQIIHLEEMLEKGIISEKSVKKLENLSQKDKQEIQKILEKVQEITDVDPKGKILPKTLQITKKDYLDALGDPSKQLQLLQKIDAGLGNIHGQISPGGNFLNIFSYFNVFFLDKKITMIQENLIDIKQLFTSKK